MSKSAYCLILPAAGSGKRMRSDVAKPLLLLGGKPILYWVLKVFCSIPELKQLLIPTQDSLREQIESIANQVLTETRRDDVHFSLIEGGKERLFSIANALPLIKDEIDIILVHDAVRPLVAIGAILQCIELAKKHQACVLGLPISETIKQLDTKGLVVSTLDRSSLWSIQTPQCFNKSIFVESYRNALKNNFFGTDDSSVIEYAGFPVMVCEGNSENIKITYPLDLKLAELLMQKNSDEF